MGRCAYGSFGKWFPIWRKQIIRRKRIMKDDVGDNQMLNLQIIKLYAED